MSHAASVPREDDNFSRTQVSAAQQQQVTHRSGFVFCILAVMGITQMVQYCSASLYLAKIPGNRYVNGIVFGCGEVWAMCFSSYLMNRLHDITAYRLVYFIGLCGYSTLILFPESVWLPYVGILLVITSIGGLFNTGLLILELRVPPQNVGAVSAL